MGTSRLLASLAIVAGVSFACLKDKPAERPQALFSSAAPASATVKLVNTTLVAQTSDSSTYKIVYVLNKTPRTGDSVRVRFVRDSINTTYPRVLQQVWRFKQKDSANFRVAKVLGFKANYQGCVRVQKGTYQPSFTCQPWSTNLPAPVDTTPPTVDSLAIDSSQALLGLYVWPKVASIKPGATQQFCAFATFYNGQVALRGAEKSIWTCDSVYHLMAPQSIKPSPQQQYIANHLCVNWAATGGTITAEPCTTRQL